MGKWTKIQETEREREEEDRGKNKEKMVGTSFQGYKIEI